MDILPHHVGETDTVQSVRKTSRTVKCQPQNAAIVEEAIWLHLECCYFVVAKQVPELRDQHLLCRTP